MIRVNSFKNIKQDKAGFSLYLMSGRVALWYSVPLVRSWLTQLLGEKGGSVSLTLAELYAN